MDLRRNAPAQIFRRSTSAAMARHLVLASLLVALASCDTGGPGFTDLDGLSGDPALLAGTWTWTRSYACGDGSGACTETTPASAGRTETLTFTHTPETSSHNGMVAGFFNGYTVVPTTYRVDTAGGTAEDRSYSLALGAGGGYNQFGVSGDRLVITSAAVDGEETTYRRQR